MQRILAGLFAAIIFAAGFVPAAAQSRQAPIGIRVVASYGQVLTDGNGWSLYWSAADGPGVSNCTDACLDEWRPLLWDPGLTNEDVMAQIDRGPLGFIVRTDGGGIQVTWDRYPVYYWRDEQQPGDVGGAGVEDGWQVMLLPPTL